MKNTHNRCKYKSKNKAKFTLLMVILVFLFLILSGGSIPNQSKQSLFAYTDNESDVISDDETVPVKFYTENEVKILAKTVYGEALVTQSDKEMSAVVWCILNRVDNERYPNTIKGVVTPDQFHGYREDYPVNNHIEWLVRDVLSRWVAEKNGEKLVGRTLPAEYLYFSGDGLHNYFRTEWKGGKIWKYELPNPYEN